MRFAQQSGEAVEQLAALVRWVQALDTSEVAQHAERRVLVTGFGPFDHHAVNGSQVLVSGLRGPNTTTWALGDMPASLARLWPASPLHSDIDMLSGGRLQLVTLLLPTLWDAAAALVMQVAAALQPELIVMNGHRNGGS